MRTTPKICIKKIKLNEKKPRKPFSTKNKNLSEIVEYTRNWEKSIMCGKVRVLVCVCPPGWWDDQILGAFSPTLSTCVSDFRKVDLSALRQVSATCCRAWRARSKQRRETLCRHCTAQPPRNPYETSCRWRFSHKCFFLTAFVTLCDYLSPKTPNRFLPPPFISLFTESTQFQSLHFRCHCYIQKIPAGLSLLLITEAH